MQGLSLHDTIADLLGSTSNPMSQNLRALLGDDKMNAFVAWMRHTLSSPTWQHAKAAGVGGGGNRSMVDFRSNMPDEAGIFRDPTAGRVAPTLTQPPIMDKSAHACAGQCPSIPELEQSRSRTCLV